jgi:hypothetical protein
VGQIMKDRNIIARALPWIYLNYVERHNSQIEAKFPPTHTHTHTHFCFVLHLIPSLYDSIEKIKLLNVIKCVGVMLYTNTPVQGVV